MAITDYASLSTAINDWAERSWTQSELDELIALAESEFDLVLHSYRREENATLTTDGNGEVSLPSGFRVMRSIVRDYAGAKPLVSVDWRTLEALNPHTQSGIPTHYAIRGSTLKVSPIVEDDFIADYEAALTGLSSGNTTNWLITIAPYAYLFMCLSCSEAKLQNVQGAAAYEARARATLQALGIQSDLAQYSNTEITLDMPVP